MVVLFIFWTSFTVSFGAIYWCTFRINSLESVTSTMKDIIFHGFNVFALAQICYQMIQIHLWNQYLRLFCYWKLLKCLTRFLSNDSTAGPFLEVKPLASMHKSLAIWYFKPFVKLLWFSLSLSQTHTSLIFVAFLYRSHSINCSVCWQENTLEEEDEALIKSIFHLSAGILVLLVCLKCLASPLPPLPLFFFLFGSWLYLI